MHHQHSPQQDFRTHLPVINRDCRNGRFGICATLLMWLMTASAWAGTAIVSVETRNPGAEISSDASGLSYETSVMLPDTNGVRYFRPGNRPLVNMFHTLGVKSLRIGGNSVDAARFPVPAKQDIRSLFKFARVAGVKVIYTVRLEDGDPRSAADTAQFIRKHFADTLDCFAIGNEPRGYYKDTNVFMEKWTAIYDAILAVWPDARFCGPDDNPSPEWCRMMIEHFGAPAGHLTQITQHSYSFGCSYRNPGQKDVAKLVSVDATAAREKMLSTNAYAIYQKIYNGIGSAIGNRPITYRLTEVNSFWYSGLEGASDRYASALWGVDYLHWWVAHGADGLNFHTGDRTGGSIVLPCRYAAFVTTTNGYQVRPLGYGLKLFSLGGQGEILPANVSAEQDLNLAAYANMPEKKTVSVTIINKAHGPGATNARVQITLDAPLSGRGARAIFLVSKHDDIAADASGVALGGGQILHDGTWHGRWTPLSISAGTNAILVTMPPASAAVVQLKIR